MEYEVEGEVGRTSSSVEAAAAAAAVDGLMNEKYS